MGAKIRVIRAILLLLPPLATADHKNNSNDNNNEDSDTKMCLVHDSGTLLDSEIFDCVCPISEETQSWLASQSKSSLYHVNGHLLCFFLDKYGSFLMD